MPPTTPEANDRLAEAIGLPPREVNNVWGQSTLGHKVFMDLPSGQTCWAKPIGLQGILESGMLGEADSLTAFVGKEFVRKVRGGKGPDKEQIDPKALMKDPKAIQKIVKMVDAVTPLVIVEPLVRCHYRVINPGTDQEDTQMIPPEDREPGVIYTDIIPLEDKMHLFNFALSGVRDAETFRKESQAVMGDVADGEGVQVPTQPTGGNREARRKRPARRRGN